MKNGSTSPRRYDLLRYILWLLVAQTAYANRRHYRMVTTWLPHFLTNTLSLLLPDFVRILYPQQTETDPDPATIIDDVLITSVRDNPSYALYVAPLALGYIVSHPNFNIYKGRLGEMRFAGLGFDAIPHAATAFALSALTVDTLAADTWTKHHDPLTQLVRRVRQQPGVVSLGLLGAVTAMWEYGEYRMHHYEMDLRGDRNAINMQWDLDDTKRDIVSNFLGWALAMLWALYNKRRQRTPRA